MDNSQVGKNWWGGNQAFPFYRRVKMKSSTVQNILNDMLQSIYEYKNGDVVYYQRQVSRIMEFIKELEEQNAKK